MKQFSSEVISKLKYYVYLISDPSNGEIFYVGKGKGNRVFSHFKEIGDSKKIKKIKEIKSRRIEPKIEILVHGVEDEITIKKIEAAIIDLIDKTNLTNKIGGYEKCIYWVFMLSFMGFHDICGFSVFCLWVLIHGS